MKKSLAVDLFETLGKDVDRLLKLAASKAKKGLDGVGLTTRVRRAAFRHGAVRGDLVQMSIRWPRITKRSAKQLSSQTPTWSSASDQISPRRGSASWSRIPRPQGAPVDFDPRTRPSLSVKTASSATAPSCGRPFAPRRECARWLSCWPGPGTPPSAS